jgi:Mn2+/Fe2+ NRAMP family transporter
MANANLQTNQEGAVSAPSTFWQYVKSFGPGIVLVLTWLGAGDVVDNAVAGANYGYTLMWALAIAMLVRFVLCDIIANYQLMNLKAHSIFDGYAALSRIYPIVLAIGGILLGHFYNSYMIKGAGEALYHLTGDSLSIVIWSVLVVIFGFLVAGRSIYKQLELVEKIILAIMAVAFIGGAIAVGPDVGAIVGGTFAFEIPQTVGSYEAMLIVISLIGAVGGSLANLLYPTFIAERGWRGPRFRKVVRYDLLFGIIVIIILDLSIWILGAQVLHPQGLHVENFNDLAALLGAYIGRIGEIIIYLGVLGATFSSVIGYIFGFPLMALNCLHLAMPSRKEKYQDDPKKDPLLKVGMFIVGVLPLAWALPGMPGFVTLTVFVNAAQVILMPLVSIGLIVMINRKDLMAKNFSGQKLQTVLLTILSILAVYGAYKTLMSIIGMFN